MIYKVPVHTDYMKEQMDHEPTRSYAEEIYNIVKDFPFDNALEIGAAWGVSALAILDAQDKGTLLSVDKDVTAFGKREVQAVGKWDHRYALTNESSDHFWARNQQTFDLIYIDGSHLYDDVRNDFFEAWKVLNDGGLLIGDDICHPANKTGEYGVSLAVWEFVKEHNITQLGTTTRLVYFRK